MARKFIHRDPPVAVEVHADGAAHGIEEGFRECRPVVRPLTPRREPFPRAREMPLRRERKLEQGDAPEPPKPAR